MLEAGIPQPEAVSQKIRAAFVEHPNWLRSEKDLRDLRQKITFALYAQEDDLDKVTSTVDHLFTLLMKAQSGMSARGMWQSPEAFKQRVREWAQKIGVEVQTISMRAMKNKWASYTQRTHLLIFNTELLDLDEDLGDYVIVHELLHFRVPNHGKLWKSLMRAHLGDYEKLEAELKRHSAQLPMSLDGPARARRGGGYKHE